MFIFRFYKKFGWPGVLGCIDGTLVAIIRPSMHEERYYNRKGYHSLNVMIVSIVLPYCQYNPSIIIELPFD